MRGNELLPFDGSITSIDQLPVAMREPPPVLDSPSWSTGNLASTMVSGGSFSASSQKSPGGSREDKPVLVAMVPYVDEYRGVDSPPRTVRHVSHARTGSGGYSTAQLHDDSSAFSPQKYVRDGTQHKGERVPYEAQTHDNVPLPYVEAQYMEDRWVPYERKGHAVPVSFGVSPFSEIGGASFPALGKYSTAGTERTPSPDDVRCLLEVPYPSRKCN